MVYIHPSRGERTASGPLHGGIEAILSHVVEYTSARTGEHRTHKGRPKHGSLPLGYRREKETSHRGDGHEKGDLRLGEREEIPP